MEYRTRSYLQLIKPGITLSNTLTAVAAYLLAASIVPFSAISFIGIILGVGCVIASACVVNNIIDRDIDKHMKRTLKRDVAAGTISVRRAILFSLILAVIGFGVLTLWTNFLTLLLGIVAYVWYVVVYGIAKRTSAWSTVIGTVAGALPPVAGYVALTNTIDSAAVLLFLMMFFWQMAHFYAIAIFRKDDYAAAKLPIWSVIYGEKTLQWQIILFSILYGISSLLLAVYGYTGFVYVTMSAAIAAYWIYRGLSTYRSVELTKWSRTMFGTSLLVMMSMCVLVAVGGYLP